MTASAHQRRAGPPGSDAPVSPIREVSKDADEAKNHNSGFQHFMRRLRLVRVLRFLRAIFGFTMLACTVFSCYTAVQAVSLRRRTVASTKWESPDTRKLSPPPLLHSFTRKGEDVVEEVPEWVEELVVRMKKMETEIHTLRKEKAKGKSAVLQEAAPGAIQQAVHRSELEREQAVQQEASSWNDYDMLLGGGTKKVGAYKDQPPVQTAQQKQALSQIERLKALKGHLNPDSRKSYLMQRSERVHRTHEARLDMSHREDRRQFIVDMHRDMQRSQQTPGTPETGDIDYPDEAPMTQQQRWQKQKVEHRRGGASTLEGEEEEVGAGETDGLAHKSHLNKVQSPPDWIIRRKDPTAHPGKQRKVVKHFNISREQCAWRQTSRCTPNGHREADFDRDCLTEVESENSGYCECEEGLLTSHSTCQHPKFQCAYQCLGCSVATPYRITSAADNCTSLGLPAVQLIHEELPSVEVLELPDLTPATSHENTVQAKIYESMMAGASTDLSDVCNLGNEARLQPPTMTNEQMRSLRLFFAVDLHNNQDTMGTFMKEFIKVLTVLDPAKVYVSVYESGSQDDTSSWTTILGGMLKMMDIPHRVISNSTDAKRSKQNRVEFLAGVRNSAMKPIEQFNDHPEKWFDHVVFLNDVMFCAKDIKRLLTHRADLACGMDYDNINGKLGFYDTWVARDINGRPFFKHPLYAPDAGTAQRFKRGQPAPVHCCWNGMAVLNAEPFHRGLQFRHGRPGECASSECSHLCKDLSYNGYNRKVVDPQVRLAYNINDFRNIRRKGPGMRMDAVEPGEDEEGKAVVPRGINMAASESARARYRGVSDCCAVASAAACQNYHWRSSNRRNKSTKLELLKVQENNAKAVDGDPSTAWVGGKRDEDWWLEVDLGEVQPMRGMELLWQVGCAANFTLTASKDGKAYEALFSRAFAIECNRRRTGETSRTYATCGTVVSRFQACGSPVEARFFRLQLYRRTEDYPISEWTPLVFEWEIYSHANNSKATFSDGSSQLNYPKHNPQGVRCCPIEGNGRDPNLRRCHDEDPNEDWPKFATQLNELPLVRIQDEGTLGDDEPPPASHTTTEEYDVTMEAQAEDKPGVSAKSKAALVAEAKSILARTTVLVEEEKTGDESPGGEGTGMEGVQVEEVKAADLSIQGTRVSRKESRTDELAKGVEPQPEDERGDNDDGLLIPNKEDELAAAVIRRLDKKMHAQPMTEASVEVNDDVDVTSED